VSRVQLALNVSDIDQAVAFYARLFGTGPAKRRPGYANFAIADPPLKLVLLENPGQGGSLNHLGVEVPDTDAVAAEQARLGQTGLASSEGGETTCCCARQDKFWVQGAPDGEAWEIYTVLADSPTFYADGHGAGCCGGTGRPGERAVSCDAACCEQAPRAATPGRYAEGATRELGN
jgi:catechol 2,3-dioxygenase-like lactoylglutathione lyase family enzyme